MTEAGWTRKKPTVAGWYWWRGKEESGIALVFPADKPMPWHTSDHSARVQLFYSAGGMSSTRVNDFGGEWLGPITPTDRQQGRVAGIKQGIEKLREREKFYTEQEAISEGRMRMTRGLQRNEASCCAHELERLIAQAAQDEKEVGDANTKG